MNYTRSAVWTEFNQPQEEFALSHSPFICGAGGQGSGKTVALVRRAILLSINTPFFGNLDGNSGVIGRWKQIDYEKTTHYELMKWIPPEWIIRQNDHIIELYNHSIIHITHFDSVDHIQSFNVGWVAIDQMEQVPEEVFDELAYRRIRLKTLKQYDAFGNVIQPKFDRLGNCISTDPLELQAALGYHTVFGVVNPKRCWVYDRFVKNEEYRMSPDPQVKELYNPDYQLVVIPTTENQMYLPTDYISRQKRTLSDREYRRYVEGMWDAFDGQVYEDFRESNNVNAYNIVPAPDWRIVVSIDHGGSGTPTKGNATNTTAVLFIGYKEMKTQYPEILVFDELYLGGSNIENTVREIHGKLRYYADAMKKHYDGFNLPVDRMKVNQWRCDPSMARGIQDTDESIMEAYMRHARNRGFSMPLTPGDNDVNAGIQRVNGMLREKLMSINPKCVHLISELKTVEFGENERIRPLQADHATDALRMGSMAVHISLDDIAPENQKSFAQQVIEQEQRGTAYHDDVYGEVYEDI